MDIAPDAGQVLTVTHWLLHPSSVDKNQIMRQQVYNCVVSAAFRHHCNVVAPSKRFCHTVG